MRRSGKSLTYVVDAGVGNLRQVEDEMATSCGNALWIVVLYVARYVIVKVTSLCGHESKLQLALDGIV